MRFVVLFTSLSLICLSGQLLSQTVDSIKQEAEEPDSISVDSSQLLPSKENLPDSVMSLPVDFFAVEVKPELIGGKYAIIQYINTHDLYPEMAAAAGINGDVIISFIVDTTGVPIDLEVYQERPPGFGFGEAAIEAIKNMRFKSAIQKGKYVQVKMQQVINFRIK